MKNWTKVVSLLTGAVLLANFAACNLVSVDEDKDMKQIVATVNGVKLTKKQYFTAYDGLSYAYQSMGMQPDETLAATALDSLVQNEVRMQKAKEDGLDKLTEEELAEIDEIYNEQLSAFKESFREEVVAELGADAKEEDIEKRIQERVDEELANQGVDLDEFRAELTSGKIMEKQQETFNETVTITDEDIQAWYEEELKTQRENVKTDIASFESASPKIVVPDGYFYVKHILLAMDEETTNKINELNLSRSPLATELGNLAITDADAATTTVQKSENEIKRQELMTQIADIDKQIADLKAPIQAKAEEVLAKINSGGDFDALIQEYGEDPGMESNPDGYLISATSTAFVQPFTDAAAKLLAVGDVSEPTWTDYGIHIIKRVANMQPGERKLEEVKEEAKEIVTYKKQQEAWTDEIAKWTEEATIEKFPDRLDDNRSEYNKDQS